MKKLILFILCLFLLASCTSKTSFDGKDRPSTRGSLQVVENRLCGKDGEPVILRGVSTNNLALAEVYIKDECFHDISHIIGANVIRLAVYTWGVGTAGYCTGGDKKRFLDNVDKAVTYAKNNDMYVIIDWHVLQDSDPNVYIEEAKDFFEKVASKYKDEGHVIYELCNEPNKCEWSDIKKYAEVIIPIIRNNDPDSLIIVGTPNWSQDVDAAANDPLDYDDLLYTLHFYSATHKQDLRNKVQVAMDKGLPLMVTEFGITASSGNLPLDIDEADIWIDFLENNGISYVMWQFSKAAEASAVIRRDCMKTKGFEREDFTTAGQWLMDTIEKRAEIK